VKSNSFSISLRERGQKHWINALTLNIFAPAVVRCAFVVDVVVYTVTQLAMWYCRIAAKPPAWLAKGARIMELAICTAPEVGLDSLNT
jgi:hypothetical protein